MRNVAAHKLDRVSSIDGLRGLAALAVLLYHARASWWVGTSETYRNFGLSFNLNNWAGYLTYPFSFGSLGVTLFFVLSGYCIHRRGARQLAADASSSIELKKFFLRRFWRIYPTYIAALLVTAIIDWWISKETGQLPPGQDNSAFAFVVSLLTLQGYLAPFFGSNGVYWTLAMEVHLYLAYPLLYEISKRYGPRHVMYLTLFAGLAYFTIDHFLGIENKLPHRRIEGPIFIPFWFTWSTGFILAEIEAGRSRDLKNSTWLLLMAGGFLSGMALTLNGFTTLANIPWALFFVGILRASLMPHGQKAWSVAPGKALAALGVFSYSLYAIHAPALQMLHHVVAPDEQTKFATIWPSIGASIFALVVGWVFYRMVEFWSIQPYAPKQQKIRSSI